MIRIMIVCLLTCAFPFLQKIQSAEFEPRDGDKIIWLGSTLIEREQRFGYWETALTQRWPDRAISFRNLAWSGDNVFGEARLAFDINNPALGLKRMVELTLAEKPSVILICYGTNESFEGEPGLKKFASGLQKLVDALAPAKARILLLSPPPFEARGAARSLAAKRNEELSLYRDEIRRIAQHNALPFIDQFKEMGDGNESRHLTDNGMHLTEFGYWAAEMELERAMKLKPLPVSVVTIENGKVSAVAASVVQVQGAENTFDITRAALPEPLMPAGAEVLDYKQNGKMTLKAPGLRNGTFELRIDGKVIESADSAAWARGVVIRTGPDYEQVEKLRQAIIKKNQLYFYKWRPQNETYLFGFRKHEQGRNAKEVAEYDPLIAKAEEEIAQLRRPHTHRYEIVAVPNKK